MPGTLFTRGILTLQYFFCSRKLRHPGTCANMPYIGRRYSHLYHRNLSWHPLFRVSTMLLLKIISRKP